MESLNIKEQLENELKSLNKELNQLMILWVSLHTQYDKTKNPKSKIQLESSLDTIMTRLIALNTEIHNIKTSVITEIENEEEANNIQKKFEGTIDLYEEDTQTKSI